MPIWSNWTGFYQQLLARIEALPGVESAGATIALPIQGRAWETTFNIDGRVSRSLSDQPQADARIVSNNYFDVMKIPLRSGRYFSEHDAKDSRHVAVINETLARRYWPHEDPKGRFIEMRAFGAGRCEIVGVVADIRQMNLNDEPAPGIYIPYTQEPMPWQTLVVRTKNDPMSLAAPIRREVAGLDSTAACSSHCHAGSVDGSVYRAASISHGSARQLRRRCPAAFGCRYLRRDGVWS